MVEFEPDVGVLVVHGIGTQGEGAELRHWVDSVVGYLDACSVPAAADSGPAGQRILQPNREDGDKFVRLLTPPLGDASRGSGRRQRWLVAEAWWAGAFDVPNRKDVSRWLAGVASWFLFLFFVRLWRRFRVDGIHAVVGLVLGGSVFWLARTVAEDKSAAAPFALLAAGVAGVVVTGFVRKGRHLGAFVVAATVVIGYPVAAVATAALLALWVVGLLPGKISEKARATQLNLAQSVGDVFALIASPQREQAMFDAISAAAKRLTAAPHMEGKPVVLVAHSQGAALAYRAVNRDRGLRDALAGRKLTVITYGAGIVPIHLLEHRLRGRRTGLLRLQNFAGLVGLLLLAFSLTRVVAGGVDDVTRRATETSVVLVATCFLAAWRQEQRHKDDRVSIVPADGPPPDAAGGVRIGLRVPDGARLRWVDLWAPWDPVPNGPLCVSEPCRPGPCGPGSLAAPDDTKDEFISCRVANLHQPWRDHVVYRDNPEEVVSRWVGEIAVRADPSVPPSAVERPARPDGTAASARAWRLKRGKYLLLGQVAALIAGIAGVFMRWDRLDDLGRRAARELPLRTGVSGVVDKVPEGLRDFVFGRSRDPSHLQGVVVGLGAVVVAIAVASVLVSRWQRTATRRFLAGRADDEVTAAPAGAAWTAAGLLVLGGCAAAFVANVDEIPTRDVRVHPAAVVDASNQETTSSRTEVRFEPVGTRDGTPVVVEVGGKPDVVELDAQLDYRITATAAAARTCTATSKPGATATDVRVDCTAIGTLLPRSSPRRRPAPKAAETLPAALPTRGRS